MFLAEELLVLAMVVETADAAEIFDVRTDLSLLAKVVQAQFKDFRSRVADLSLADENTLILLAHLHVPKLMDFVG